MNTQSIHISSRTFAQVFHRFEQQVEFQEHPDGGFQDFQSGLIHSMEQYKEWLYLEARRRLNAEKWKENWIGKGKIITAVVNSIEIYEDKNHRNNIVEWQAKRGPKSRTHIKLLAARDDRQLWQEVEQLFWDMYVSEDDPESCFERLVYQFGARYGLISYLFFIRDWSEYVPVRSTFFPNVFELLGVPHPMIKKCSWQNYCGVIARLREVQRHLQGYDIPNGVRLIDAHSFCWLVNCLEVPKTSQNKSSVISSWKPKAPLRGKGGKITLLELEGQQKKQKYIGDLAQNLVLDAERDRLKESGRSDLADLVTDVSDNLSLGYDIDSFTTEGESKPIEVKAAALRGRDCRFFLSENERLKSREIPNYHFVIVIGINSEIPELREFKAAELPDSSLHPIQYEIRLINEL